MDYLLLNRHVKGTRVFAYCLEREESETKLVHYYNTYICHRFLIVIVCDNGYKNRDLSKRDYKLSMVFVVI